ncbi:hypothetical protein ACL6C3_16840 [Capilliphycus salinus ALCB114379]|uniref:hypothetical protein n=1 Tax=Capilliphycus salinus TaxID=2768948 RepID=UPI0039A6E014
MKLLKSSGTQTLALTSAVTSIVTPNIATTVGTIPYASYRINFNYNKLRLYKKLENLDEAPLPLGDEKLDFAVIVRNYPHIRLDIFMGADAIASEYLLNHGIILTDEVEFNIPIEFTDSLTFNLVNTGHGLLTGDDKINVILSYEYTVIGE